MKRNILCLGMLPIILAFGMTVVGCDDGSTGNTGGGKDALDGTTWTASYNSMSYLFTFNSPNFSITANGTPFMSGTYTVSGSTVTLTTVSGTDTAAISGNNLTFQGMTFTKSSSGNQQQPGTDNMTWIAAPLENLSDWPILITYGNNKFVAVQGSNKIRYSSDGITWADAGDSTFDIGAPQGYTIPINDIAYGNNKFVAVGAAGTIRYSTDGITWTPTENGRVDGNQIFCITYGNNKFVIGGNRGKMAYSTDGITWTAVTNSTFGDVLDESVIRDIAYGNGKFVAIGPMGQNFKMATSTDGISWTAVTDNTLSNFFTTNAPKIAYGSNKFVVVGQRGQMAYSSDGTSWTAVTDSTIWQYTEGGGSTYMASISDIVYGNNKFVAVGGVGKMATSSDGVSWKAVATTVWDNQYQGQTFQNSIRAIAYGNNRFVAGGSGKIAYSTDNPGGGGDILNGTAWTGIPEVNMTVTISFNSPNFYLDGALAGTYTVSGNTATLTIEGVPTSATISGNTLIWQGLTYTKSAGGPPPNPGGDPNPTVYISGYVGDTPCYWKDGVRIDLVRMQSASADNYHTYNIAVAPNGDVHVVGRYYFYNNWSHGYWYNGILTELPIPISYQAASDTGDIAITPNGDVYIAGYYAGMPCYWKNKTITDLSITAGSAAPTGIVIASNGDIYVSGYRYGSNISGYKACYWKNGERTDLPDPDDTTLMANGIAVASNGDVYIAGYYTAGVYTNTACYWKNGERTDLPVPAGVPGSFSNDIAIASNADVYIVGYYYNSAAGNTTACYWKNGTRTDLLGTNSSAVGIAISSDGDVYISGVTGNSTPCYWKNGVRTNLPSGSASIAGATGIALVTR